MTIRRSFLLLAACGTAACASPASTGAASSPAPTMPTAGQQSSMPPAPPPVADIDPVGTYAVNLTAQGNPMSVNAKIERRPDGGYGGTVTSDVTPPLPITSVRVKGKTMRVAVNGPDGVEAILNLTVDGDLVSGDWKMGSDGSAVSGKKLP